MFSSQEEFNKFYDKLLRYAEKLATDLELENEDAYKALWLVEDLLTTIMQNKPSKIAPEIRSSKQRLKSYIYATIKHDLFRSSEKRIHGIVYVTQETSIDEGTIIVKTIKREKFLRVRIGQIKSDREREIVKLHQQDGLRQKEIVDRLRVSKQYVSKVLKKYLKYDAD